MGRFTVEYSGAKVLYRDLAAQPIAHLSGETFAAQIAGAAPDDVSQEDFAIGASVLDEFLAADTVVIGVAFYNFGISSQLKVWGDRIAVPGKALRHTEKGPEGLAGDKHVILAIARGGFYGSDTGRASYEHAESYLRAVFGFLGVTKLDVITAEGMKVSPEQRERAIAAALDEIGALAV